MNGVDLGAVWKRALTNFLNENVPAQQRTWLSMVRPIALADDTIVLGVPNDFLKDLIERKLRPLVAHALSQELGRAMRLAVMIDTTAPEQPMQSMQEHHPQPGGQSIPRARTSSHVIHTVRNPSTTRLRSHRSSILHSLTRGRHPPTIHSRRSRSTRLSRTHRLCRRSRSRRRTGGKPKSNKPSEPARLNPKYTFETFVIGASATASRTPRRWRSPRRRPRRTTRCSSTATPAWARPTCCTRSGTTRRACSTARGCGT